jgi:hypothetical protein
MGPFDSHEDARDWALNHLERFFLDAGHAWGLSDF